MRFGLLTTAALTLGSMAIPAFAKADRVHDDHRVIEHREVIRHDDRRDVIVDRRPEVIVHDCPAVIVHDRPAVVVTDDCNYGVALADVPGCVVATVDRQGFAGRVETVQFVRRDGQSFYRFRVDDGRRGGFDVRVALDGDLLGIAPAA